MAHRAVTALDSKSEKNSDRQYLDFTTFLLTRCRGVDEAVGNKKGAERSKNWCHSNDDETGNNAVQRFVMLSSTIERKASITSTVISRRKVNTAHSKMN